MTSIAFGRSSAFGTVPMPSCSICEQFLYLIKTQCRRRRLRRRLGQRVSGCHIGQVEAIPESGPEGAPLRHDWDRQTGWS
jgi:hypothetical protein